MQYKPYTEKQIAEMNLWPDGEYDYEVQSAKEAVSSAGNEMLVLENRVFHESGRFITVTDYITVSEKMAYKLRHAAEASGILDKYDDGSLAAIDFVGRTGRLKLNTKKDKDGVYADQNAVKDYVVTRPKAEANGLPPRAAGAIVDPALDDEIPF